MSFHPPPRRPALRRAVSGRLGSSRRVSPPTISLTSDSSLLTDEALPAVQFLTGPGAADVLRAPIEAAGGELISARPRNVQYRPGSDLIVKYAADVVWPGKPVKRETIMAASRAGDCFDGTVPVAALIDGRRVEVGVWRWPFDPVLNGLTAAVTPHMAAELCAMPPSVSIEVLAFRPTERAVVRVSSESERCYIKVVPPSSVPALVDAHRSAAEAGVPVPRVRASCDELGIVVLDELTGPLLKAQIKAGSRVWPLPDDFNDLADSFARIGSPLPMAPSRVAHAVRHAAMLRGIAEAPSRQLDRLVDEFRAFRDDGEPQPIHGDLHEGQIIVADGKITGVLDLDDLGVGSALEERANLLGFLRFRAITLPAQRTRIDTVADELRVASVRRHDLGQLDVATAAVLVGLATGPFRIQQPGWQDTVTTVIDRAATVLGAPRAVRTSTRTSPVMPTPITPIPISPAPISPAPTTPTRPKEKS